MADNLEETVDMFAGMKKKKKSSKKVLFDGEGEEATAAPPAESTSTPPDSVATPEPAAADDGALDFSDLKKKKKKKSVRIASDDEGDAPAPNKAKVDALGNAIEDDEPAPAPAAAVEEGGLDEFADLKKKKKKSKKAAFDVEAFEKELQESEEAKAGSDEEGAGMDVDDEPEGEDPFGGDDGEETMSKATKAAKDQAWLREGDRDYEYTELLGRFYGALYAGNPSLSATGTKKKYTLAPPQMYREGSKRSVFANVVDIAKKMNRSPEHVIQFLFSELGTTGSVDASSQLVIKGRFQQKQIENVLRRYITEYVACSTCKSPDTTLTKDNRLFFIACQSCGANRSVSGIKTGFAAQVGKRRAMRTG